MGLSGLTLIYIYKRDSNVSATQMVQNEASVMSLRLLRTHLNMSNGHTG